MRGGDAQGPQPPAAPRRGCLKPTSYRYARVGREPSMVHVVHAMDDVLQEDPVGRARDSSSRIAGRVVIVVRGLRRAKKIA